MPKTQAKKPSEFKISSRELAVIQNWRAAIGLPPKLTAVVESCALSTVNDRLARNEYQALKDGAKTIITTESILERRARLQRAKYKAPASRAVQQEAVR
jgi:hypothetical protein